MSNPTHVGYGGELVEYVRTEHCSDAKCSTVLPWHHHAFARYVVYRFRGKLWRCLENPTWQRDYTAITGSKK